MQECLTCGAHEPAVARLPIGSCREVQLSDSLVTSAGLAAQDNACESCLTFGACEAAVSCQPGGSCRKLLLSDRLSEISMS